MREDDENQQSWGKTAQAEVRLTIQLLSEFPAYRNNIKIS